MFELYCINYSVVLIIWYKILLLPCHIHDDDPYSMTILKKKNLSFSPRFCKF